MVMTTSERTRNPGSGKEKREDSVLHCITGLLAEISESNLLSHLDAGNIINFNLNDKGDTNVVYNNQAAIHSSNDDLALDPNRFDV